MKKIVLFTLLLGVVPCAMLAQDDMYLVAPKSKAAMKSSVEPVGRGVTYSGSNRDVDEYNRHGKYWSHYQKIGADDKGNDIISFQKGRGIYPDSSYIDTTFVGRYYDTMVDGDDYEYTGRMSRWDGFYDPWFYGSYRWRAYPYPYWRAGWGWYDPWYYGYAGYYDPWYGSWYSPWYYGYTGFGYGYPYSYYGYGWYSPYSYYGGYYGWGYPGYSYSRRHTGTLGYYDRSNYRYSGRSYGNGYGTRSYGSSSRSYGRDTGSYNNRSRSSRGDISFGSRRPSSTYSSPSPMRRSSPVYSSPSRSSSSGSFGGGSFGNGSRSGGFSTGGSHGSSSSGGSRGGGTFGGGRR